MAKRTADARVERMSVSAIKPAPYNPRVKLTPDDPEYQKLKSSLATFTPTRIEIRRRLSQ